MRMRNLGRIGLYVWRAVNAAGTAAWLWSIGGASVVGATAAIAARAAGVSRFWMFVLGIGVLLLAAAAILTTLGARKAAVPDDAQPDAKRARSALIAQLKKPPSLSADDRETVEGLLRDGDALISEMWAIRKERKRKDPLFEEFLPTEFVERVKAWNLDVIDIAYRTLPDEQAGDAEHFPPFVMAAIGLTSARLAPVMLSNLATLRAVKRL